MNGTAEKTSSPPSLGLEAVPTPPDVQDTGGAGADTEVPARAGSLREALREWIRGASAQLEAGAGTSTTTGASGR